MANKFNRPQGGCETVYFSEIEGLRGQGFSVAEFSMREKESFFSDYEDFFIDEVDFDSESLINKFISASKVVYNFEAKKKLESLVDFFSPDIFHAHNIYHQMSPSVFSLTKNKSIPSVMTSHDLKLSCPNYKMYVNESICSKCVGGKYWNCMANRCSKGSFVNSLVNTVEAYVHDVLGLYNKIDRIICPSYFNAEMLISSGYDESKISVLPNGIDLSCLPESKEKEGYVLYVGRITKDKGIANILEAAKRLTNVDFKIAGDGPDRAFFEAQAENLKNVAFLGFKSRKEVDDLISSCSAVIVSSLLYENCPMSVLETMAQGKVVVASAIGGIPEIIKDGVNGFLYYNDDIGTLCDAIDSALLDDSSISIMEHNAKQDVMMKYSQERHVSGLIDIYRDVLK